MKRNFENRLKRIEKAVEATQLTLPVYHCIIDGEVFIMSSIEFAWATMVEGKQGEKRSYAGERPITPLTPKERQQLWDKAGSVYEAGGGD